MVPGSAPARRTVHPPRWRPSPSRPRPLLLLPSPHPHRWQPRRWRHRPASATASANAPATGAPTPAPTPVAQSNGDGVGPHVLSPMVRKLLAENGISESEVTGTGSGGRITRDDALRVVDARRAAAAAPPPPPPRRRHRHRHLQPLAAPVAQAAPAPPVARAPQAPPVSMASFRAAGDQVVPFSNMRRRTAEHMVRSKATSPHAFIANEVDFESVERVRKAWGERFKAEEGFALTYLPFVARAAVEALRDFPLLNASVVDDSLLVHAEVNLGIAVDLSHEGLIVPVIHRAEEVTLRGVARRIRDLAERARGRQLNADDIAGGTFSITNDGPFGTYFTVPIINQPQVAILATDGIARRPVVVTQPDGSESIAIHSTGILGVSWDHRAVDGAYVSLFLAKVSELLGSRDWAAEL